MNDPQRAWLGMVGAIALTAAIGPAALTAAFEPYRVTLDLSRETDTKSLGSAWRVDPVPQWPGVVQVFDRGIPAALAIDLPRRTAYQLRLKVTSLEPSASLTYTFNGVGLGTWHPTTIGAAEKRRLVIPASAVHAARNQLEVTNSGPPGSVLYEQVRVQNFQKILWKGGLYLVPEAAAATPLSAQGHLAVSLTIALGGIALSWLATTAWKTLGRWPMVGLVRWHTWSWLALATVLAASCQLPHVTPYRLLVIPGAGLRGLLILWGIGQLPVAVISALRRLAVSVQSPQVSTMCGAARAALRLGVRGVLLSIRALGQGVFDGAKVWWRWFRDHQHALAYLGIAVGLLGLGVVCVWVKWLLAARLLGNLAAITAMIGGLFALSHWFRENS